MSDEPKAIQGTRRTAKEMADGTLRVQIDVEPRDKKAFHALFPEIDMPVAIAPLKIGPQQAGSWPGDIIHIDGKAAEVMMERMTPGQIISDPRLHDYGQQAKELRQSDFFRRPEVWRAVGTDQEFLDWLKTQDCAVISIAGVNGSHYGDTVPAHVRRVSNGSGTGIKPQYSAIPLCDKHHQLQHQKGESAIEGGRHWFDQKRIQYLQQWCWESLKQQLGYDSWKQVPPWKMKEWALKHSLERYLPDNYYSSMEDK